MVLQQPPGPLHEKRSGACRQERGTVRNSVRWAMMMKRRESSHGYRERTSGPAPG
ncbi:nitrile hydratase subunit alpha, partial [Sinorhizobium meliloti]